MGKKWFEKVGVAIALHLVLGLLWAVTTIEKIIDFYNRPKTPNGR